MGLIPWAQATESVVGRGHPTLSDVANRAVRFILSISGFDPDAVFPGLYGPVYNVKAFGAVGDGITDDTAAVNAAIIAAGINGGVVYAPAGSYKITSTLLLLPKVSIWGDGERATVFLKPTAAALFKYYGATEFDPLSATYERFSVSGGTKTAADLVFLLRNTGDINLRNLRVTGQYSLFKSSHSIDIKVEGSRIISCERGLWLTNDAAAIGGTANYFNDAISATENNFSDCTYGIADDGSLADGSRNYRGNLFNPGTGTITHMHLGHVVGADIAGNSFEMKNTGGMTAVKISNLNVDGAAVAGGGGAGVDVHANWFYQGARHVHIVSGDGVHIGANHFYNPSVCAIENATPGFGTQHISPNVYNTVTTKFINSAGGFVVVNDPALGYTAFNAPMQDMGFDLADGATVTPDLTKGNYFTLAAGGSRTINGPTGRISVGGMTGNSQLLELTIINNTAGAIATTFSAAYRLGGAWVDPAAGKTRTIRFRFHAGFNLWLEMGRTPSDV